VAGRRGELKQCGRYGSLLGGIAAIVLVTSCGSTTRHPTVETLTGIVYSAPSCPVERADSTCPPRPVEGAVVQALSGERVQAQTNTNASGRFRLLLPYGEYTIRASNVGAPGATATQTVRVGSATPTVALTVDSGIR